MKENLFEEVQFLIESLKETDNVINDIRYHYLDGLLTGLSYNEDKQKTIKLLEGFFYNVC